MEAKKYAVHMTLVLLTMLSFAASAENGLLNEDLPQAPADEPSGYLKRGDLMGSLRPDQIVAVAAAITNNSGLNEHKDIKNVYRQFLANPTKENLETVTAMLENEHIVNVTASKNVVLMPGASAEAREAAWARADHPVEVIPPTQSLSEGQLVALARTSPNTDVEKAYQQYMKDGKIGPLGKALADKNLIDVKKEGGSIQSIQLGREAGDAGRAAVRGAANDPTKPGGGLTLDMVKEAGKAGLDLAKKVYASLPTPAPATPAKKERFARGDQGVKFESTKFRCLHGGFVVEGNKKCNVSSMREAGIALQNSKIAPGLDLNDVDCRSTGKKGKKHASHGDATALCNPFKFGLKANGDPICVKDGKDVTNACNNKLKDPKIGPIAKKWALEIRKKNPGATHTMEMHESRVCSENAFRDDHTDGRFTNVYLQTDKQIEDVKRTCTVLAAQNQNLGITLPEGFRKFHDAPGAVVPAQPSGEDGGKKVASQPVPTGPLPLFLSAPQVLDEPTPAAPPAAAPVATPTADEAPTKANR